MVAGSSPKVYESQILSSELDVTSMTLIGVVVLAGLGMITGSFLTQLPVGIYKACIGFNDQTYNSSIG